MARPIKNLKNASKLLRPKATFDGKSLDIDSIYNHIKEIKKVPEKNFRQWRRNFRESGLWIYGDGKDGFSQVIDMDEWGSHTKGYSNIDDFELMKSWANTTDDEINAYVKRLQSEGYRKKDLIKIKDQLQSDVKTAKTKATDTWFKKGTSKRGNETTFKKIKYKDKEYFLLGEGKRGFWSANELDSPVFSLAVDAQTGKQVDFGKNFFNKNANYANAVDAVEDTDFMYSVIQDIEDEGYYTSQEMQDEVAKNIERNKNVNNQDQAETPNTETNTVPDTQQNNSNINWDDAGNWDDDFILNQAGDDEQLLNDMINARDEKVRQTKEDYNRQQQQQQQQSGTQTDNTAEQVNNQTPEEQMNRSQQTANAESSGIDPNNPITWDDDYIRNAADGDPEIAQQMINQRDQAIKADKYKGIDPDKPGTWTEDYINDTAKTTDELEDMMNRMNEAKNKDIVNQINQQRHAEDVPKNRAQRRAEAKENRQKGNQQKSKTKKQRERDARNKKFEDRNRAMGRDPEETKRINREANENKQTNNRQRQQHQEARNEKARLDKERANKIYDDIMDDLNSKSTLEQMSLYGQTEAERKLRWQQQNKASLDDLEKRKLELEGVPDNAKNVLNENIDAELEEVNRKIEQTKKNLDDGYSDPKGFKHYNINEMADDYVDFANEAKEAAEHYQFDSYTANRQIVDKNGKLVKTPKVVHNLDDGLSNASKVGLITTGVNILGAVGDYKDERRKGHGVVSSAVRAGVKFAAYEALGLWSIPVMLVASAPGAVVKGADMLYKENRRMNSAANFQVFGGAQFQDTQQLATMRQSGMEMAKMAQYNLQQTLMGNEATYLHR